MNSAVKKIVLASASKARRALLEQAGLSFEVRPASIDEQSIIADLQKKIPAADIALELARRKAAAISEDDPLAFVIGCDQILTCGGKLYQKSASPEELAADLKTLRGQKHQLISAVCVVEAGKTFWSHADIASLTMKNFNDEFIDNYINAAGGSVLNTVGGYELEGLGPWLFEKIEGDYFTILGLPLVQLLSFLQTQGYGP